MTICPKCGVSVSVIVDDVCVHCYYTGGEEKEMTPICEFCGAQLAFDGEYFCPRCVDTEGRQEEQIQALIKRMIEEGLVAVVAPSDKERKTIPALIVERATRQADDLQYSLEEALGDVMGDLLYNVEAELSGNNTALADVNIDSLFYKYFMDKVKGFFGLIF